jgi:hypothetical protein
VGIGVAEIGQHAVAHELGDVALEALDHAGAAVLVGANDLPQVFRVQGGRHGGRAHQVAEHHGELTSLGFGSAAGHGRRDRRWGGRAALGDDRFERYHPRAQVCAAVTAELLAGRAAAATGGTDQTERRAALAAESLAFWIAAAALLAVHQRSFQ